MESFAFWTCHNYMHDQKKWSETAVNARSEVFLLSVEPLGVEMSKTSFHQEEPSEVIQFSSGG